MTRALAILSVLTFASAARADVDDELSAPPPEAPAPAPFEYEGYVQPQLQALYRPGAVPSDRWDTRTDRSRVGIILAGEPVERWRYTLHLSVETGAVDEFEQRAADSVEEATVGYRAARWLDLSAGQMRIPLTLEQQISSAELVFPNRSGPNELFLQGADAGALAAVSTEYARVSAGGFAGRDDTPDVDEQGPQLALRVDVTPLGALADDELGRYRGPLRVGVGAGLLYRPSEVYDEAGFEAAKVRDLRAAASVRVVGRGFSGQAELLRRQRTDSLSSRPVVATGAYAQASYFAPLSDTLGLAPLARVGWFAEDQSFDPRETVWVEAGASLYLLPRLRITLQYMSEHRTTEGETAHGALTQAQLRF